MTRDDILRIAHEAGILEYGCPIGDRVAGELERFAALVAESERDACAKICESELPLDPYKPVSAHTQGQLQMAEYLAGEIRARNIQ